MEMKASGSVLLFALAAVITGQRPGYLGGPVGLPELASRFKNTTTTSLAPDLGNRLDDSSSSTPKIPVDARGDTDLVNRINDWPRKNWPFWLLNAEHIEKHRDSNAQQNLNAQRPPSVGTNMSNSSQFLPSLEQRFGERSKESAGVSDQKQPKVIVGFIPGHLP